MRVSVFSQGAGPGEVASSCAEGHQVGYQGRFQPCRGGSALHSLPRPGLGSPSLEMLGKRVEMLFPNVSDDPGGLLQPQWFCGSPN